jgi:hypothetical protein
VGRHIFFSRDFVYTRDFGLGVPGSLRIGDAVQLSANFPGGFPFRRLCADMFRFVGTRRAKLLVVTDGGGYDNTATSWYLESQEIAFQIERLQNGDKLAREARAKFEGAKEAAEVVSAKAQGLQKAQEALEVDRSATKAQEAVEDFDRHVLAVHPEIVQSVLNDLNASSYDLITINAAYPPAIQHASLASLPVLSDLLTFTKTTETLYNNDNHQRLRHLRRLFLNGDLNGALVSVEEHPAQLVTHLSDAEKWFSGRLPETTILAGPEAKARSDLVSEIYEIYSFFTRLEYPKDDEVSAATRDRAREALEHLCPGYHHQEDVLSPEETRALREAQIQVNQLEEELKRCNEALRDKPELSGTARAVEELRILQEVKKPLSDAKRELLSLKEDVNNRQIRQTEATSKLLPLVLELVEIRNRNRSVATTLRPLGVETTASLLYQGYLCAMMNLHALMSDYPLVPIPSLQNFREIASGRTEASIPQGKKSPAH